MNSTENNDTSPHPIPTSALRVDFSLLLPASLSSKLCRYRDHRGMKRYLKMAWLVTMSKTALSRSTEVPSGGISHLLSTPLPRSIVQLRCDGRTQTRDCVPENEASTVKLCVPGAIFMATLVLVARPAGSSSSHQGQHGGRCGQDGHRSLNSLGPVRWMPPSYTATTITP